MVFVKCWLASLPMDTRSKNAKKFCERVGASERCAIYINQGRMSDIKLDPGFKEFYAWCKANDIPVIIVSRFALPT